jgi:hypothetical protein
VNGFHCLTIRAGSIHRLTGFENYVSAGFDQPGRDLGAADIDAYNYRT